MFQNGAITGENEMVFGSNIKAHEGSLVALENYQELYWQLSSTDLVLSEENLSDNTPLLL